MCIILAKGNINQKVVRRSNLKLMKEIRRTKALIVDEYQSKQISMMAMMMWRTDRPVCLQFVGKQKDGRVRKSPDLFFISKEKFYRR